MYIRRSSLS
jgi:hypothetical protein